MTHSLVLALDIGSSSVRCSAYDRTGRLVDGSLAQYPVQMQSDGTIPVQQVTQGTARAVDDCLVQLRQRGLAQEIAGVGCTSFAMSWLGVDAQGRAVTPLFTYAGQQGGPYARQLRQTLAAGDQISHFYQRTGTPIHTAYAPAQLLWLAAHAPDLLDQTVFWQTISSHLLAQWSGVPALPISSSEAAWTGLLDRTALTWDESLLAYLPIDREQLPPVHDYADTVKGLSSPWAQRWPELAQLPFCLAVGDGVAANIGSGCHNPARLAVTVGTSAAIRTVVTQEDGAPAAPQGLWAYRVDRRRHLVGGALTDGGSLYTWLQQALADGGEGLAERAAHLQPDSHGLTILPFLNGERSPGWADQARLTLDGISAATTPAHLLRAGMEAVALRLGLIAQRLLPLLAPDVQVIASGGALDSSPLWRQILADVLNHPVHLTQAAQATSRGAAILAWQAFGLWQEPETPLPIVATALPDPTAHASYQAAGLRQERLYQRLLG